MPRGGRRHRRALRGAGHRRCSFGLEAEFRASVGKRAPSVEWRSARAWLGPFMVEQARAADVIVVGARSETIVDQSVAADPSDLVMQAGRPLMVVPSAAQWLDLRSVVVAWK